MDYRKREEKIEEYIDNINLNNPDIDKIIFLIDKLNKKSNELEEKRKFLYDDIERVCCLGLSDIWLLRWKEYSKEILTIYQKQKELHILLVSFNN